MQTITVNEITEMVSVEFDKNITMGTECGTDKDSVYAFICRHVDAVFLAVQEKLGITSGDITPEQDLFLREAQEAAADAIVKNNEYKIVESRESLIDIITKAVCFELEQYEEPEDTDVDAVFVIYKEPFAR